MLPRIRQAVLVTTELEPVVARLRSFLGRYVEVPEPFRDEGVGHFGLENAVLAVGDSFLEVLAPVEADTAGGRHLKRRGGDSGYMVMLQVADMAATRERLAALEVRVVWQTERPDAVDVHLHPRDVPGALVAVDTMDPPDSWRWGGPAYTGANARSASSRAEANARSASSRAEANARSASSRAEVDVPQTGSGLSGLTVAVTDPAAAAARWAAVAGVAADGDAVVLDGGRQRIDFVPASDERNGLVGIGFALAGAAHTDELTIGDTTIEIRPERKADHG
jgi:hypothetical protein